MSSPAALIDRFFDTIWTAGRLDLADQFLHPDLVDHDALDFPGRPPGAAGLVAVVGMIRAGIPDLARHADLHVVEGDLVATRFTDRGAHAGPLLGVAPTGRAVEIRGINIQRVRDGRIAEIWHVEDIAGLLAQIQQ